MLSASERPPTPNTPMPQPPNDPVLTGFIAGALLLSIATGLFLVSARRRGPLLRYQPRRPVPWGAEASILAVLFVLLALVTPWDSAGPQEQEAQPNSVKVQAQEIEANPVEVATQLIASMLPQVLIVGGFVFVVAVFSNATSRDLGLPANAAQFAGDVFIGIVACLAALAPVHVVQASLMYLMKMPDEPSGHPLVKMLTGGEPNVGVMVLATLAAVVVAPICEEISFRLLLQGWLEKWEDKQLGWRTASLPSSTTADEVQAAESNQMTNDEGRMTNDDGRSATDSSLEAPLFDQPISTEPPRRGIVGLPYGWLPIFVSSLMFGLAHFGYGPEPVPLFFLALVLGYVYHRTHRIVPCIVAHALFNLFTVVLLWRMLIFEAQ